MDEPRPENPPGAVYGKPDSELERMVDQVRAGAIATLSGAPSGISADRSDRLDKLATKLARVQHRMKLAERNADNPFFRSTYSDLGTIMETARAAGLHDEGLMVHQSFEQDPAHPEWLTCVTLIVDGESGQWVTSRIGMSAHPKPAGKKRRRGRDDEPEEDEPEETEEPGAKRPIVAQDIKGAATYARRVGWQSAVGVAEKGEDDDGNRASGRRGRGGKTAEWAAYLEAHPDIAEALKIENPTVKDIAEKAPRFGKLTEGQEGLVMKIYREHQDKKPSPSSGTATKPPAEKIAPRPGPATTKVQGVESTTSWPPSEDDQRAMFELIQTAGIETYRPQVLAPTGGTTFGPRRIKFPKDMGEAIGLPLDIALKDVGPEPWVRMRDILLEYIKLRRAGAAGGSAVGKDAASTTAPDTGSTSGIAKGGSQDSSHASDATGSAGASAAPARSTKAADPKRGFDPQEKVEW